MSYRNVSAMRLSEMKEEKQQLLDYIQQTVREMNQWRRDDYMSQNMAMGDFAAGFTGMSSEEIATYTQRQRISELNSEIWARYLTFRWFD